MIPHVILGGAEGLQNYSKHVHAIGPEHAIAPPDRKKALK